MPFMSDRLQLQLHLDVVLLLIQYFLGWLPERSNTGSESHGLLLLQARALLLHSLPVLLECAVEFTV